MMVTAVSLLKKKLEEAGVSFIKGDTHNSWTASMDGEVITEKHRTLSQCVWDVARQLGEEI